ncbi:Dolichyl-phosphate-mannose-protein mannosyltransferase-domain-containing protein [Parasitella parasitica]|nr:Dolichyl-phosphate-mannose-protein mannosyltransferase-domain-containing protein [Parasitella parasitica]
METLKRRHPISQTPDSPPPKYSDTYEPVPLSDDDYQISEKDSKVYKAPIKHKKAISFVLRYQHTIAVSLLTLLSCWTRFYLIGKSRKVVWDEAHFGKFGSFYLRREFYFDVHPPLGKMLVGLSGVLANYNGSFGFESGKTYPEDLDITTMRMFNAAWGIMLVPLAYGTAHHLNLSWKSCVLAASFVLFDNALLTISRFVLLDSMLLFFTGASFFCLAGFRSQRLNSFSLKWWAWLFSLGISLGCVLSVKWVGLFAVALAGTYTVEDLWDMLGDLQMPKKTYFSHWLARGVCLIAVPMAIYMASFAAHFHILSNSGPGDANMGSLFQARLNGSIFRDNPLEIAFGSNVTIKNFGYGGGLLHSHPHQYPDGSKQQQVTCYSFKDNNNIWQIRQPRNMGNEPASAHVDGEIQYVKHGDVVRLHHVFTQRNLHSHPINAPISSKHWEVSAYGNEEIGDIQDNWRVEIVQDIFDKETTQVKALTTRFRLHHIYLDCVLASRNVVLPQWGFKQQEVFCDRKAKSNDYHTWWNVEDHRNDALPPAPKNSYKSNFFEDFWHLNVAMWNTNNALIPDPDKNDILSSGPTEWPMVTTGLRMCGWDSKTVKFYLLGNPSVWWPSFLSIVAYIAAIGVYVVRQRRQHIDMTPDRWANFTSVGKLFFLGWFFHYIPFFMMGRVTYIHHYFPALYFSVFMVPFLLEHFFVKASSKTRHVIFAVVLGLVIANFIHFAPFSFGMTGDIKNYSNRLWLNSWNLIENRN